MRIRVVSMYLLPCVLLLPAVKALAWQQAAMEKSVANGANERARSAGAARQTFLKSPVEFQPNRGQFGGGAEFVANAANYSVVIGGTSLTIMPAARPRGNERTSHDVDGAPLRIDFVGASAGAHSEAVAEGGAYANYLVGNDPSKWLRKIPLAERVRTRGLYPGVDLDYYGNQNQLEYDLTLAPGADARVIQLSGGSIASVEEGDKGELVLRRGDQTFVMHAPVAYQMGADGVRRPVRAAYQLATDAASRKVIRFDVGEYDHTRTLVIDPTVTIVYATYLGGSAYDLPMGVAVDAAGSVYVTGMTYSTDYPTMNPMETSGSIYLSKLNAAGTALVYSTYLGGSSGNDSPGGVLNSSIASGRPLAVDSEETVYLVGTTQSPDFPVTPSAFQQPSTSTSAPETGFLLRLSADGTTLLYSTAFGSNVTPSAVAVDNNGHAYMTGTGAAESIQETGNAYYTPAPGSNDYMSTLALLVEFDTSMSGAASVPYSTVFGHLQDGGVDVALDSAGNVDLLGVTGSVFGFGNGTIDIAGNAYESGPFSVITPWIAQFSLVQHVPTALNASTYLGGAGPPGGQSAVNTPTSMGVDGANHIYITGTTTSATFPTFQAIQGSLQTPTSGFLTEMTTSLQYLVYSTYIGDDSGFAPSSIAVARNGDAVLTGYGAAGLITVNGISGVAPPMNNGGNVVTDGVLLAVASGGQSELYATYLGTGGDGPAFVAIDASENAYRYSSGGTITPTANAAQSTDNSSDGNSPFLIKLTLGAGSGTVNSAAITSIVPVSGANTGVTTVNLYGVGFDTVTTLALNCGSQTYTGAILQLTSTAISAYVDLRGAPVGTCDIVLANATQTALTDPGAFTVDGVAYSGVDAQVIAPAYIREGTGDVVTIAYGNSGNTDAYSVPLDITFPSYLTYTLVTPLEIPAQVMGGNMVDYSQVPPDYNDGNGNTVVALVIPIVRTGSNNVIEIRLGAPNDIKYDDVYATVSVGVQAAWEALNTAPDTNAGTHTPVGQQLDRPMSLASVVAAGGLPSGSLGAASQNFARDLRFTPAGAAKMAGSRRRARRFSEGIVFPDTLTPGQTQFLKDLVTTPSGKACISDIIAATFQGLSLIPGVGCAGDLALSLASSALGNAVTADGSSSSSDSGVGAAPIIAGALYSALGCFPATYPFKAVGDAAQAALNISKAADDCSKTYLHPTKIQVRGPGDPNFKAGPAGAGAAQYIPTSQALNYSVNFANEPTAGASAQNVTATDLVDPTKVDLSTFAFGTVVIGNHYFTPVANATSINTQIDLRPDVGIIAQVTASLNQTTGLVTWQFGSLDPSTGNPISPSSLSGFLPPDTAMPNGEVAVSFSANLLQGLTTGATVNNTASIVFDGQPAMATNTWTNTIDANAPHSSVSALPANTAATAVDVSWSGTDAGSGIATYSIYVSDNGGPFSAWLGNTASVSAVFLGTAGHLYGFFSQAVDAAGNIEPARNAADTSTTLALGGSSTTLMPVAGAVGANAPVILTATVVGNPSLAGTPTGSVAFYSSSSLLGTATLSGGIATYTASGFAASSSINADYGGDVNYASSDSSALALSVVTLPAPTISFTVPNQIYGVAPIGLSAASNSGGALSYTVVSGPASVSGSTLTVTGAGAVTVQANQAATSVYASGMKLVSFTVAQATPVITWTPSATSVNSGLPIGAGVLDAASATPGSFLYQAMTASPGPIDVSTTSVLPAGSYTLTATFTPTDTSDYATVTATVAFTVAVQHVWIVNSGGSVSSLDDGGNELNATPTAGGGIGIAIDNAGDIWSIHTGGASLSEFNNAGVFVNGYSGGGLSAAAAIAIDGSGAVWVANGNGSVSEFTNAGAPLTPSTGFTGGGVDAPSSVGIDISGNIWIANSGNSSVTKILGGAAPVAPLATGVTNKTLGAKP